MGLKTAFVIDDSRVARVILGRLLGAQGLEVTEIESGEEALTLLKHGVRPDVIFVDMVMPGLSGVETTVQIKSEMKLNDIPVVMCTGNDTTKERQTALAAGVSSIVAKPPVEGELEMVLAQFNRALAEGVFEDVAVVEKIDAPSPEQRIDKSILIEEVVSEMNERFEQATQDWMPVMQDNVASFMAKEQRDLDARIVSAVDLKAKEVSEEVAGKIVENLAAVRVAEAIKGTDLAGQLEMLLAEKTPAWLEIQQGELEKTILPSIEKKLTTSLATEMAAQIEQGMTSEAMLQMKANVQEDTHAMLEEHNNKMIKPLQYKVYGLMGVVVFLILLMLIF